MVVYTNTPKHTSDEENFHPHPESTKKHVEEETYDTLKRPTWSEKEKVRSGPEIIELGDPKWAKLLCGEEKNTLHTKVNR